MQYITSVVCSYQICTPDWVRKVHTRSNIGAPNSDSFFPVNYCSMFSNLDDLVMVFDHFPSISENAFGTRYTKCWAFSSAFFSLHIDLCSTIKLNSGKRTREKSGENDFRRLFLMDSDNRCFQSSLIFANLIKWRRKKRFLVAKSEFSPGLRFNFNVIVMKRKYRNEHKPMIMLSISVDFNQ